MPRGNRGNRSAAWLVAAIGIALASYAINFGLSEQRRYTQEANQSATEYAAYTADQVKGTCLSVAKPEQPQCMENAKAEGELKRRDNRREYDDLVAQQKSALWTGIMGFAAITGMILSVVGVYLVYATFDETRKANEISKSVAEAAAKDAKSSRDALVLAERAVMKVVRAAVKMGERKNSLDVSLIIENTGRSNAHRFRIDYNIGSEAVFPERLPFNANYGAFCQPDTTSTLQTIHVRVPSDFPRYMMGMLTYATVHDANFKSFFCLWIGGRPGPDDEGREAYLFFEPLPCKGLPHNT